MFKQLTVIGSGQMGIGIAYAAISKGHLNTIIYDVQAKCLSKGHTMLNSLLQKQVAKNNLTTEQAQKALQLVQVSSDLEQAVKDSDIVIEAIPEKLSVKMPLFEALAKLTKKDTILGSNTSSISLTKIASAAKNAENRVIGLHFFNPVPVLRGAEIIRAEQTSDETFNKAKMFMDLMGKTYSVSSDSPGFIANRILIPMINEAIRTLQEGVSSSKDIDSIMKLGCGMPMGPLELADLIGLDTILSIMTVLEHELGDSIYKPSNLLIEMVSMGKLGRKTGSGFYEYAKM